MQKPFRSILRQPYQSSTDPVENLKTALGFGVFVFLFLWIFQPFQIHLLDRPLIWVTLGFGLVTFGTMVFLNVLIPMVMPGIFREETWTVGKELCSTMVHITVIGFMNFLFFSYYCVGFFLIDAVWWFQGVTLAVGIIPVSVIVLLKENRDRRKFEASAAEINKNIQPNTDEKHRSESTGWLTLTSQTSDENLTIFPVQLYYIKAADNYVEVYFEDKGQVSRRILRNTLKAIDQHLESHPDLFRCHKSYLVNLSHVHHLSGNAQGYKLHLQQVEEPIPVSRQHNESIKNRFVIHP